VLGSVRVHIIGMWGKCIEIELKINFGRSITIHCPPTCNVYIRVHGPLWTNVYSVLHPTLHTHSRDGKNLHKCTCLLINIWSEVNDREELGPAILESGGELAAQRTCLLASVLTESRSEDVRKHRPQHWSFANSCASSVEFRDILE